MRDLYWYFWKTNIVTLTTIKIVNNSIRIASIIPTRIRSRHILGLRQITKPKAQNINIDKTICRKESSNILSGLLFPLAGQRPTKILPPFSLHNYIRLQNTINKIPYIFHVSQFCFHTYPFIISTLRTITYRRSLVCHNNVCKNVLHVHKLYY